MAQLTSGTTIAGSTAWHSGNDGSGSGLDADTVDGIDSSRIVHGIGARGRSIDRTNGNANTSDTSNPSGFNFGNNVTGMPTTDWWTWINVAGEHWSGNDGYGFQIANSFWDDNLRIRRLTSGSWNSWNTIWHSGNDGSGSGLDADLLDGQQGSYYSPTSHTHSYLPLAGGTMTGVLVGRNCTTTTVAAANDAGSMSIRGSTTTPAVVSFHRPGVYAINFGLSTANKMEMGGWSASTIKHTWDMSGNYTAVGNITAYSDIRVKTNIDVIPEALDKVKQLSGYTFDRTDFIPDAETGVMPETRQTGVIAQEVLKVLPEAVTTMDDGKYAVAYGNMVGLLIEAIKEQQTQIDELKALVQALIK